MRTFRFARSDSFSSCDEVRWQGLEVSRARFAPLLVGLVVFGVSVFGAHALLNDGDTLSHIAIGRWIIAHRAIPFHDPFTYTFPGRTWIPHEWLAEVSFAFVYDHWGWGGVVAISALSAAGAFALLTRALIDPLGGRRAIIGGLAAFSLAEAHLLARPHVLAWPLLVVWMAGITKARDENRAPSLALLPLMTLWCNLHGGFVVGLGFAGLLAIEAVTEATAANHMQVARRWGSFLALAVASALISPNGTTTFLLPFKFLRMGFASSAISEWHAVDFTHFDPILVWILAIIFGGFRLGVRLPLSRTLMSLLLLYEALAHVRNEELLGIILPLLVATPLSRALATGAATLPPTATSFHKQITPSSRRTAAFVAVSLVAAFFSTVFVLDSYGLAPRQTVAPVAALEAARAANLDGHVLNSIRFGGYLMFEGVPTFIDGRADLFGDRFLKGYAAASNAVGNGLPSLLRRYKVQWAIYEPSSPAVTLFDYLPGWERLYTDRYAVVFCRKAVAENSKRQK